jgi:hypothetical protein
MSYSAEDLQYWGTSELIEEILKQQQLLTDAHDVLKEYWFNQEDDSYNNDDVIEVDQKITKHLEGGN